MCEFYATFWEEGLKTAAKGKTNVFILADSNLPDAYLEEVVEVLSPQIEVNTFVLEGGEGIKTLEHAQVIYNELDNMGADRKTLFVCLGGGTVSDLGGFAASTFKRGITLVILPTTVLAIVDAAIGGKNGVNFKSEAGLLKNQIGTFHSPEFIGYNPSWLESLPSMEVRSGWAEMVKHGLIQGSGELLGELYGCCDNEPVTLKKIVPLLKSSAAVKEAVVNQDPTEKGGRVVLNLGHTVGHALESYSNLRHGEAVAWGLVFMLETSKMKNGFSESEVRRLQDWIVKGVGVPLPEVASGGLWGLMIKDKKNSNGTVTDLLFRKSGDIGMDFIWKRDEFTTLWEQFRSKFV